MLLSKDLWIKFIKYSLVGSVSTLIYFLSVFIFVELFGNDPLMSSAISFIIMTIFSFILNKKFTFNSDFSYEKLLRFFIVSAVGFTLNFLIMFLIVNALSYHYIIGEIATTLIIPLINFALNHYWTFK